MTLRTFILLMMNWLKLQKQYICYLNTTGSHVNHTYINVMNKAQHSLLSESILIKTWFLTGSLFWRCNMLIYLHWLTVHPVCCPLNSSSTLMFLTVHSGRCLSQKNNSALTLLFLLVYNVWDVEHWIHFLCLISVCPCHCSFCRALSVVEGDGIVMWWGNRIDCW